MSVNVLPSNMNAVNKSGFVHVNARNDKSCWASTQLSIEADVCTANSSVSRFRFHAASFTTHSLRHVVSGHDIFEQFKSFVDEKPGRLPEQSASCTRHVGYQPNLRSDSELADVSVLSRISVSNVAFGVVLCGRSAT